MRPRSILPIFAGLLLSALVPGSEGQAQAPPPSTPPPTPSAAPSSEPKLGSGVFVASQLPLEKRPNGSRRAVLDAPTATLDRLHTHITTLNPGEKSGEPRLHRQEEVIIVTDGTIVAHFDGEKREAPAGSVIFFQANAVTYLENPGPKPATYYVVYYHTPLTPKG